MPRPHRLPRPPDALTRTDFSHTEFLSVRDGRLLAERCDVVELAERFGTPLFVVSETQLREDLRRFRTAFAQGWPDGPVDVLPAMTADTTLAIRQVLSQEGAGACLSSPEELVGVLTTGVDPQRVSVHGGGKTREHLRTCVAAGVRITVEDRDEVDLLQEVAAELGTTARVRFRLEPVVPALWRRSDLWPLPVPIDLALQVDPSGLPVEQVVELGHRVLRLPDVELVGLHVHAGRHAAGLWYWKALMTWFGRQVAELSRAWGGWPPQELDVGGGMAGPRDPHHRALPRSAYVVTAAGSPLLVGLRVLGADAYHAALSRIVPALVSRPGRRPPPTVEECAATITGTLRRELHLHGLRTDGVRLQVEPGRGLLGGTGIHLTRVRAVRRQAGPLPCASVLTDTTCTSLTGGGLAHDRHPLVVANRADAPLVQTADLVGQSGSADRVVLRAELPEVEVGDVLAVLETGAYVQSRTSNAGARPRPATVLVVGHDAEVVKRAESVDDVFARDVVPDRLHPLHPPYPDAAPARPLADGAPGTGQTSSTTSAIESSTTVGR